MNAQDARRLSEDNVHRIVERAAQLEAELAEKGFGIKWDHDGGGWILTW